jgi:hypothetical protein
MVADLVHFALRGRLNMGGGLEAIPMALSLGSKLFGVTGAQAAGVPGGGSSAVSPFTAALMGGQGAGGAPVPPGSMLDPNVMKDQSRLNNLDEAGALPARSPFRTGRMVTDRPDLDQPTPVKTQRIDPKTGGVFPADVVSSPPSSGPVQANTPMAQSERPWKTETVQGVPMQGGIMMADQSGPASLPAPPKPSLFSEQPFDTTAPKPGVSASPFGGMFDAVQGKLKALPTNPMGQVGLSLLASGYDGSNPYAAIQRSLGGIQPHELALRASNITQSREDRDAAKAADDQRLAMLLQSIGLRYSGNPQSQAGSMRQAEGQARVIR